MRFTAIQYGTATIQHPTILYDSVDSACHASPIVIDFSVELLYMSYYAGSNNAARVAISAKKYDHVTPVLKDFQGRPIRKRIEFMILLLYLVTEPSVPMHHAFGMSSLTRSRLLIVCKTTKTLLFPVYLSIRTVLICPLTIFHKAPFGTLGGK